MHKARAPSSSSLLERLNRTNFDFLGPKANGKVGDIYTCQRKSGQKLVTADRLSAFDRIWAGVCHHASSRV